jgi:hypothetical protein
VIIGDDGALLRTVGILHRERALDDSALSLIPVGQRTSTVLARELGVPCSAVAAARAALDGVERTLDLLLDDDGGIVLGALRIPGGAAAVPDDREGGARSGNRLGRGARSLVRTLTAPLPSLPGFRMPNALCGHSGPGDADGPAAAHPLRVEADGVLLADTNRPVREVSVRTVPAVRLPDDGFAEVVVRHGPRDSGPLRVRARAVTVSGPAFRYRDDTALSSPVLRRTWTVQPGAWRLAVPG